MKKRRPQTSYIGNPVTIYICNIEVLTFQIICKIVSEVFTDFFSGIYDSCKIGIIKTYVISETSLGLLRR